MTTEVAVPGEINRSNEPPGDEPPQTVIWGRVIIEWPQFWRKDHSHALSGWQCTVYEAESGHPVVTVDKLAIPAVTVLADRWVTCELTMFADETGEPILFPEPHPDHPGSCKAYQGEDGRILRGTFTFLVTEMRVRGSAPVEVPGQH